VVIWPINQKQFIFLRKQNKNKEKNKLTPIAASPALVKKTHKKHRATQVHAGSVAADSNI